MDCGGLDGVIFLAFRAQMDQTGIIIIWTLPFHQYEDTVEMSIWNQVMTLKWLMYRHYNHPQLFKKKKTKLKNRQKPSFLNKYFHGF